MPPGKPKRGTYRILREFNDDLVEIMDWNGRLIRTYFHSCAGCRTRQPEVNFEVISGLRICFSCRAQRIVEAGVERRRLIDEKIHARRKEMAENGLLPSQRRAARVGLATPRWVDRSAIRRVKLLAKERTRETGIEHHVDHIHPIAGDISSGLNVPWNLQVLEASANCSKYNSFDFSQSPAWSGTPPEDIAREVSKMWRDLRASDGLA